MTTPVLFEFYDPYGDPIADREFEIRLPKSGSIPARPGVVVPDTMTAVTGPDGKVIVGLMPSSSPYFVTLYRDPLEEDCCDADCVAYRFYVPDSVEMVRAQDLFLDPMPSSTSYDEAALLAISEARALAQAAAIRSETAADNAEDAQAAVEEDALAADAAAAAALVSKNAAAVSATTALNSAASASDSATAANTSKVAAALSETNALASKNAAAASATTASNAATTATTQATSATGSATTATTQAAAALASKNAAALSATSASTSATTATTQAGIATTEANRSKTEADRATAATDGKQPLATNLTAFAGLAGAADRLPYFTGAGALSLVVLTAKARLLFARTDTAGMQAELGLVPVASVTDVTAGRLATYGWMGLGKPIPMASTDSADTLPYITATFLFGNGGSSLPAPYVYIDQYCNGDGTWTRQIAYGVNSDDAWERFFVAGSANSKGWKKILIEGDFGVGGMTPTIVGGQAGIDGVTKSGSYYAAAASDSPIGYAFVDHRQVDTNTRMQMWHDYAGSYSGLRFRTTEAGAWGPFDRLITAKVVTLDPASGGVMSSTVVNGFTIDKYANGVMVVTTPNTQTPTIAATDIAITVITLPVSFIAIEPIYVEARGWPLATLDCYGVVCQEVLSVSAVRYAIRNGGTAQIFRTNAQVIGRWKV